MGQERPPFFQSLEGNEIMRSTPIPIWTNVTLPASGTLLSPQPQLLDQVFIYCIQIEWTGTPVGTFKLQGSCDKGYLEPSGVVTGVTNWTDLTGFSQAAGGGVGTVQFVESQVGYRWVRIVYTAGSSTGTVNATISIKGI